MKNNEEIRLVCPRCGSQDIAIKIVTEEIIRAREEVDMNRWEKEYDTLFGVPRTRLVFAKETATCDKCGYHVERTR